LAAAFQAIEESLPGIAVLFAISLAIGLVVLAVGLHRRRLWAWRGIWYLLGIDWLLFALSPVSPPISMNPLDWWFLRFAGFGLAWVLPNFVYFKKRRALFC
jgi:hypothetical protein